ncbi:thermonuclease family protein [Ureibacillus sp. FSL K6-8385]|uniref:Thermonuclease family protein n=1 Tax=Ureibacillus terrenus TaxID=118246 RepID=A0A540V0W4_9BACL|nr:thermonuclease family protein [Ureibacillus terrenus]MED3662181.1 thermonuclease family protein [Ureibacillus terrenus]MED3765163.1 thermonuclease family protein [Ureibacillus terrenus]TQE90347.1 thermonuclease family protein [Ureibacillus terrenus]
MKRLRYILYFVFSAALLFGCASETADSVGGEGNAQPVEQTEQGKGQEQTSSELPADMKTIDAEVVSVVDGDTIKVKINGQTETVRFLLVDTPETNHPRLGEQPFGQDAKEFTKKMLEGKTVQLEKDVSDRDKYGRLLYYVYVDGKSVQEELLKNGLARVAYVYVPNTKYVDRYYEIQKEAQKKGVGIWSIENYAQEDGFHEEVIEKNSGKNDSSSNGSAGECNIKGNISSNGEKIYHMPGQQFYDVTKIDPSKGERYFCSREEAERAGFRPSER